MVFAIGGLELFVSVVKMLSRIEWLSISMNRLNIRSLCYVRHHYTCSRETYVRTFPEARDSQPFLNETSTI